MTIARACFSLTKTIEKFDFIEQFHEVILKFNHDADYRNYIDFANHLQLQAYAFILIINNINRYSQMHQTKYRELDSNDKLLIEKVHLLVSEFNRKVINRSFGEDALLKDILMIYNHKKDGIIVETKSYYDKDIFNILIEEFSETKQMHYLIKNKNKINNSNIYEIRSLIFAIEKELEESYPWEVPTGINEVIDNKDNNKIKLCLSIIFIRAQLKIVNQLLYQAFSEDRLFCVNKKNTFDKSNDQITKVGRGFSVNIIDKDIFSNKFNNFIVYEDTDNDKTDWAMISPAMEIRLSQEFGFATEYKLRILDNETLNPYFNLAEIIYNQ